MTDDCKSVSFDLVVNSEKNGEQELPITVDVTSEEWTALRDCYAKGIEILYSRGLDPLYDRIVETAEREYTSLWDNTSLLDIKKIEFPYEIVSEFEGYAKVSLANAVFGYFSTLYYLNRRLIMLCSVDVIQNSGQYETDLQQIILDLPRLIPYRYNKAHEKQEIDARDGLMEFSSELPFLRKEYENLLSVHDDFLDRVRRVRNKLEHIQHGARLIDSDDGGPCGFSCSFLIKEDNQYRPVVLHGNEFICCVEDLNTLFSKIQSTIEAETSEEELAKSYYSRILRYRFSDFNLLYHNPNLYHFGQALFPF